MITLGSYVQYKDHVYLVIKDLTEKIVCFNPNLPCKKVQVNKSNTTEKPYRAQVVTHKERDYLVTPKEAIISLTSGKLMQWDETNGDRQSILSLVDPAKF